MHGRPHDVIDVVGVVLERVQRLVVLEEEKKKRHLCMTDRERERERVKNYSRWREKKDGERERRNGERE